MAEEEAPSVGGSDCPECGIAVAPGYPRCPKCHAVLPGGKGGLAAGRTAPGTHSGGTSVVDAGGGGFGIWVAVIGILAVAGGVALLLMSGNGSEQPPAETAKPVVEEDRAAPGGDVVAAPVEADVEDTAPSVRAPSHTDRIAVLRMIARALDGRRLWATVDLDGDVNLQISSAHCADEGMRAELVAHAADLSETGFELVRCNERHGAQVFELAVSELSGSPPEPLAPAGDDGAE